MDVYYIAVTARGAVDKLYRTLRNAKKAIGIAEFNRETGHYDYRSDPDGSVRKFDVDELELAEQTPEDEFAHAERQMLRWTQRCIDLRPGDQPRELPKLTDTERELVAWWLSRTPEHLRSGLDALKLLVGNARPIETIETIHLEPSPSYVRAIIDGAFNQVGLRSTCRSAHCIYGPPGDGPVTGGGCDCLSMSTEFGLLESVTRLASAVLLLARQLAEYRFSHRADACSDGG